MGLLQAGDQRPGQAPGPHRLSLQLSRPGPDGLLTGDIAVQPRGLFVDLLTGETKHSSGD